MPRTNPNAYAIADPLSTDVIRTYVDSVKDALLDIDANGTFHTAYGGGAATNLDGLSDVVITSPAAGQVVKYNGSAWINDADLTSSGGGVLPHEVLVAAPSGSASTDTTNINTARNAAAAGGVVVFRNGTYLTTGLTLTHNDQTWLLPEGCVIKGETGIAGSVITITGHRAAIIGGSVDFTLGVDSGTAVRFQGSRTATTTTLSVLATKGDTTITVASAASINAGDIIMVRSNWQTFNNDRPTTDFNAEYVQVLSKSLEVLTLNRPLRDSYAITGGTVSIDKMSMLDRPVVSALRVVGKGVSGDTFSQTGIDMRYCLSPRIELSTVVDCAVNAFLAHGCIAGSFDRCIARGAARFSFGYGFSTFGCDGFRVIACEAFECRTGFDEDAHSTSGVPMGRDVILEACHAVDCKSGGYSSHAGYERVTHVGCHATGCGHGFIIRAKYQTIINPQVSALRLPIDTTTSCCLKLESNSHGGRGLKVYGGNLDATPPSGVTITTHCVRIGDRIDNALFDGVQMLGANNVSFAVTGPVQVRDLILHNLNIDGTGTTQPTVSIAPSIGDGNNIDGLDIVGCYLQKPGSTAARIKIGGNSASTAANLSRRIVIRNNRIRHAPTAAIDMATGFFDGAEVIIADNDCPETTSQDIVSLTVANWSVMPIQRDNVIASASTNDGRGFVATRSAAPTTGTWLRGDVVINSTPAAGGNVGWICTTGGTPGTFKTWGGISA